MSDKTIALRNQYLESYGEDILAEIKQSVSYLQELLSKTINSIAFTYGGFSNDFDVVFYDKENIEIDVRDAKNLKNQDGSFEFTIQDYISNHFYTFQTAIEELEWLSQYIYVN